MSSENKQISFCISCRNRLWQLEKTLKFNLDQINDDHEIVLVDFGSSDSLNNWVWSNFSKLIEDKKLVFFEVKNDVNWSSPRAKNLAHRLANASYFFNLDADNFITLNDINLILQAKNKNLACHQFTGVFGDGSFGRIGLSREIFHKIGGYDESMLPMGAQDLDLLRRINSLNIPIAKLPRSSLQSVENSHSDKVQEFSTIKVDHKQEYEIINSQNLIRSELRFKLEGPNIRGGFATFQGLLNGEKVIIDGLGNLRRLAT